MSFSWECPFCNKTTTIVSENHHQESVKFIKENVENKKFIFYNTFVLCPNKECKRFTFKVSMFSATINNHGNYVTEDLIKTWSLIPASHAIVLPSYIPQSIINDYDEACLIRDLSPKASATLSRRCLQGMIRDYWDVSKDNLYQEIESIKDKLDPLTWSAITAIRKIGNIGAHMERDINVIVDVEPKEAQLLIGLIETLIKEWYISRYETRERMKNLVALSNVKEELKKK